MRSVAICILLLLVSCQVNAQTDKKDKPKKADFNTPPERVEIAAAPKPSEELDVRDAAIGKVGVLYGSEVVEVLGKHAMIISPRGPGRGGRFIYLAPTEGIADGKIIDPMTHTHADGLKVIGTAKKGGSTLYIIAPAYTPRLKK
jgi:hypothetical protein